MDGSLQMISKLGMIKRAGGRWEGRSERGPVWSAGLLLSFFCSLLGGGIDYLAICWEELYRDKGLRY